ncbi:hypothetical protein [Streptomyces sp. H27-C3]|uniref:hypothetical protein n=1 Tax=Streptomyces sp. H27-C3 TaxID=3046305 RepID=UPI0024BA2F15|nr:hypothetical protein [Streptomyces sp. H27-C3]MDJ0463194.1 hypothetical protein [Streptomyces sp. H27-C3]
MEKATEPETPGIYTGVLGIVQWLDMLTNNAKNNARDRYPGWAHHHIGEILKTYGRVFHPESALPVENPGPSRRCFHNSMEATFAHDHLTYVEGFASAFFPTEHAWCADASGSLYEPTWDKPGTAYFGIPFKWEAVAQANETNHFIGGGFVLGTPLMIEWMQHGFDESLLVDIGEPLPTATNA